MIPFAGIVEKDEVDSNKIVSADSSLYHFFWMKDKTRLTFNENDIYYSVPDSGIYYWLAYDKNEEKIEKFNTEEVSSILVKDTDWVATSFLVIGVAILITLLIADAMFPDNLLSDNSFVF